MLDHGNFLAIAGEVRKDIEDCGIKVGEVKDVFLFSRDRMKKYHSSNGICIREGDGSFRIGLHPYLAEGKNMHGLYSVLAHEMLHAGPAWDDGHEGQWKRNAAVLQEAYPGKYTIKDETALDELGLGGFEGRYEVSCAGCGGRFRYATRSNLVKMYDRAGCPSCGRRGMLSLRIRPKEEVLTMKDIDFSARGYAYC